MIFPRSYSLVTILIASAIAQTFAQEHAGASSSPAGAQMNNGARIECVTPDGQTNRVSKLPEGDTSAVALIMEDDTVSCVLQEGETNFVVELPRARLLDRLTFLNENAKARGELKISVSNNRLKADSSDWVEVEGVVPFSHKRLFGVSLIGIDAKFVRLSFKVAQAGRIAAFANHSSAPNDSAPSVSAVKDDFKGSALNEALDSPLASRQTRDRVLLTSADASVGPISPVNR